MNKFLNKIKKLVDVSVFDRIVIYMKEDHSGCWIWSNSLDKDGYGRISINKKQTKAHRLIWELKNGKIPTGLVVDHKCKVRNCVNPEHLRIVTSRQNVLENSNSFVALNALKKFCKKGHFYDKVYTSPAGEKERYCSTCHNERTAKYKKIYA